MAKAERDKVRATGPTPRGERAGPARHTRDCGRPRPANPSRCPKRSIAAGQAFDDRSRRRRCVPRRGRRSGWGRDGWPLRQPPHWRRPHLSVPIWVGAGVCRPCLRRFATLVLAVSCSGGTAVDLTAAEKAVERGFDRRGGGGQPDGALAELAADAGLPWCPTPATPGAVRPGDGSESTARAALGATTVPC